MLIRRKAWHARAATGDGNKISANPYGVALHYADTNVGTSGHALCGPRVLAIQRFHQVTKGWNDIAYSFCVCAHGFVYEGRGTGKGSAANGTTKANADYYAVCALIGPKDTPTPQLLAGIGEAIGLCRKAGARLRVVGHRDLFSTSCPGDALYALVRAGHWTGSPSPPVQGHAKLPTNPHPIPVAIPTTPPKPAQEDDMVILRTSNGHHFISNGVTKREMTSGEAEAKWLKAGVKWVPMDDAEINAIPNVKP